MDHEARENWSRYLYGRDRGHLDYMERAAKCEGMYLGGGEQWDADAKAELEKQGRPAYEFNEIMPSVNSAVGYQIHNRMDIAFRPRGQAGDLETATILSKVAMQIADMSKLHWHETQVFGDGLIEQRGYFEVRVNFDDNIMGEIEVGSLDPRDVIPDPDAKTYNPDGWADVIITRWLTLGEIEQLYGGQARAKAEASGDESQDFGTQDNETERSRFGDRYLPGTFDAYGSDEKLYKRFRIIDRQKFVYERTKCLVWPETGDIKVFDTMTPEQAADALAKGATTAMRMRRRVKWVVSTYSATIFDQYSPYEHFTPVPYFAYFRRGKTRGLVDNGIGPQEALNKAISQFVHIINTSANSGWITDQNSVTNMEEGELEERGAETGLHIEVKEGARRPEKITANSVPSGVDRLIDRASQALKDVTVPEAMRGTQGPEVSGIAIQAKQFASQQQLAVPLDNLAYTRQLLALRILKLIQRYYDSYRVFRITETDPMTGKPREEQVEINKFDPATGSYMFDITVGTYDVVITEQPMQVTFENSQFQQALEMRKEGIRIPDATVIRYSNLSDKHDILANMTQEPKDPTVDAKAELLRAQAAKTRADTTNAGVTAMYSATQAANVIATNPTTAGVADKLLRSAGFQDQDAAPIVPEPEQPMAAAAVPQNTDPLTPASPAVGVNQGIETLDNDGAV